MLTGKRSYRHFLLSLCPEVTIYPGAVSKQDHSSRPSSQKLTSGLLPLFFLLTTMSCRMAYAQAVLETDSLRVEISEDALLKHLISKHDGADYALSDGKQVVATVSRGGRLVPASTGKYAYTGRWVYRGGQVFPATGVTMRGDTLTIGFGGASVTATYRIARTRYYLAFELIDLEGPSVDRIDLLQLRIRRLPYLGQWVNVAHDDRFGICLCAGNLRTHAEMNQDSGAVVLRATADRAVGLLGGTAVLFGVVDPKKRFLDTMEIVESDFKMPSGAANRRSPVQKYSYLWAGRPTTANIGDYIKLAKWGGFRMILFSYTAFARGAGHFVWNSAYPAGMADLKNVTDAIRNAGLKVGLHIHYTKAHKNDAYVTPVPDGRLRQLRRFSLAAQIGPETDRIPVGENPEGCTLDKGRRILKAGDELIAYEDYTTKPPFQFQGCRRGHLGTASAEHSTGAPLALLDVDTWPSFVRYDQNTDIQDETARRIADIYHQTGPYEMVYFDGAEDVHAPFWYHVASAQHRVYSLLKPEPPVCEAAHYTHFSWHMISRSNAYDIVAPANGMKDFCRLMPCPTAAARAMDFSRIEFGWLGRFGGGRNSAGPDVWEYVASRAAAWDCPISLKVSLEEIASNPRAQDCLHVIKTWEDARIGNHLTEAHRRQLRNVAPEHARYVPCFQQRETWNNCSEGRSLTRAQRAILTNRDEHHLFVNESGRYELVEIEEVPGIAGDSMKAYLFRREEDPPRAYVLLWAVTDRVELQLPVPSGQVSAMRPFGVELPLRTESGRTIISIGRRTYLVFTDLPPDGIRKALRCAE